jgi:uncharacterized protein
MTLITRLKTSACRLTRATVGTGLGLAFAAALLAGLPSPVLAQDGLADAPRAEGPGPALWVVRDADSTLYLFGTVHMLRPTTAWGSDRVDAAFASASQLILEVVNPDDEAAAMPLIMQHGITPARPLSSLLTAKELADLDAVARTMDLTAAQLDPMRPWLAALTLSVAPLAKAGYDPKSGVDLILRAAAAAEDKPISGFETLDEQISILAGFPEEDQLTFLRSTLEEFEDASVELDKLVEAWAAGDMDAIAEIGVEPMRESSELVYQSLLVKRNTNWADQIQALLEGSGTAFIAVGAAHLAGDDSVQTILESRGVAVTRQ